MVTSHPRKVFGEILFKHGIIQTLALKAGNCESFFGNEGKDVKQRKFFTANNLQYTV